MLEKALIAEDLFTWPSEAPQLIGSQCLECSTVTFPIRGSCPACCSQSIKRVLLPRRGTLWTWTIQSFRPKSPPYIGPPETQEFEPYGVGYVELGTTTRVEGRLTIADPQRLKIGMEMEVVVIPLANGDGQEVLTYGFAPVEDAEVSDSGSAS